MICCLETADLHSPALRKHGYFFFPSFFHKGALFSLKTSSGITVNRQTIEIAGAAPLLSGGVCERVRVCVRARRDCSERAHQFGDEWREEQQFDFSLLSQLWLMEWHPLLLP